MPELDTLAYVQLAGLAVTWLLAVVCWFWRIRKSTGTDRDILMLILLVGGAIALTLAQIVGLIMRLG